MESTDVNRRAYNHKIYGNSPAFGFPVTIYGSSSFQKNEQMFASGCILSDEYVIIREKSTENQLQE